MTDVRLGMLMVLRRCRRVTQNNKEQQFIACPGATHHRRVLFALEHQTLAPRRQHQFHVNTGTGISTIYKQTSKTAAKTTSIPGSRLFLARRWPWRARRRRCASTRSSRPRTRTRRWISRLAQAAPKQGGRTNYAPCMPIQPLYLHLEAAQEDRSGRQTRADIWLDNSRTGNRPHTTLPSSAILHKLLRALVVCN